MDLEPAIALVSTVAGSAATAAGGQAWQSLVGLFRRATGRGAADPADPVDPGDAEALRVLVGRIVDRARSDEEFGAQLRQWAERHQGEVRGDVHNTVSGDAKIDGPVIQARDIHGGISFG